MAYQNVGTPRFYIDIPTYLNSLGVEYGDEFDKSLFNFDPTKQVLLSEGAMNDVITINLNNSISNLCDSSKFYFGLLNHNFGDSKFLQIKAPVSNNPTDILNTNISSSGIINEDILSGCSILTSDRLGTGDTDVRIIVDYSIGEDGETPASLYAGSLTFGSYYDMPQSPDLDLSMKIEFDGYDQIQTMGGSTLTNVRYAGSPWWYDKDFNKVEPWSVGQSTGVSKRNGRRSWSMKFSYISDKDIFASNYMSNNYIQNPNDNVNDEYNDNNDLTTDRTAFEYTLDNDDCFIAQVLNKIGNGDKFIFQPDNTTNNPSDFAICQLDQDSLSIKQVAYKTYEFGLKIREVW